MTDTLQVTPQSEIKPEVVADTTPQLSDIEQGAYKEGWRPKEEYEGPVEKWIPADEYMRRKPLFERIDGLKSESFHVRRELQETKKALNTLMDHHKKVRETEYKRAMEELKAARREALEHDNYEQADKIEERLDEIKDEHKEFNRQVQQQAQITPQGPSPEFVEWVKDNSWYHTDRRMHNFADTIGREFMIENPNAPQSELFKHVTKEVKETFADKFKPKTSTSRPSPVDSGDTETPPARQSRDSYQLSAEEEQVAKRFEDLGVMTRKQYVEELKKYSKR